MAERTPRSVGTTGAGEGIGGVSAQGQTSEQSAADMIRAGTGQALDEAKTMVRDAADQQRRKAAESLGGMAQALHRSAQDLKTENGMLAQYTDIAADKLDQVAGYLRQSDWNDILEGAENVARRQPYWFIGGAMAAGFVMARFVKNSSRRGATTSVSGRRSTYQGAGSTVPGYGQSTTTQPYTTPGTTASSVTGDVR
ncbi:MAG: hypothetical protein ACM33T_02485 [Solirubrobacterales bacterium]